MTNHLLGSAEVAALLQISRARVSQIAIEDETFPKPVAVLAAGRVWSREEIEAWGRAKGRLT